MAWLVGAVAEQVAVAVAEQAVVGVAHVDHCEVLSYLHHRCLVGLVRCILSVLVERFARSLVWLGEEFGYGKEKMFPQR